ncbi:MAG: hypothetical protein ABR549_10105, partial [Mycobacteriales bacterium]
MIELMVALTILALVAAGVVPLLISGAKAASAARLHTQAKNQAQQRIETLRDMQFHVDRQNGPFVDLLDVYYTNLSTTPLSTTRGGETLTGRYVASGGVSPQPTSGPFYKVTISQLAADAKFSQEIDTQFLNTSGAAVPASQFSTYNSQVSGSDNPPTQLVGVTVTTTWTAAGSAHRFTTYTRISDTRGLTRLVTTQGKAEFARVTSTGPSGNPMTVDLALAEADGSQTTGSTASADLRALFATDGLGNSLSGATGVATSPGAGGSVTSPVNSVSSGAIGCGWLSAGPTSVTNVTAGTTNGLPQVPSNVGSNATAPASQ